MANDHCIKCSARLPAGTIVHPNGDFMCQLCSDYNALCLRRKELPDWNTFITGRTRTLTSISVSQAIETNHVPIATQPSHDIHAPAPTDLAQCIENLPDLSGIEPERYPNVFIASLDAIFRNTPQDIHDTVSKADMSTLSEVHKILCSKITVIFPKESGL